tara:strand:+ start:717 stop:1421 length:705 start_codon:yes stop_codon:yes gene_type:complete
MKVLGIIPARSGSKGIPNKNIKIINNKPLVYWTIKSALNSKLDKVIVSTDSKKIKLISKKFGAEVPFLRPRSISKDNSKSIDLIIHALKYYNKKKINYEAVMLLQPTCPLRKSKDINSAIEILRKDSSLSSVISVQEIESTHPGRMKYLKNNIIKDPSFAASENLSRQKLKKIYLRSGLIYLSRSKNILNNKTIQGKKSYGLVTPNSRSFNIDNFNDFNIVNMIMKKKLKIKDF